MLLEEIQVTTVEDSNICHDSTEGSFSPKIQNTSGFASVSASIDAQLANVVEAARGIESTSPIVSLMDNELPSSGVRDSKAENSNPGHDTKGTDNMMLRCLESSQASSLKSNASQSHHPRIEPGTREKSTSVELPCVDEPSAVRYGDEEHVYCNFPVEVAEGTVSVECSQISPVRGVSHEYRNAAADVASGDG